MRPHKVAIVVLWAAAAAAAASVLTMKAMMPSQRAQALPVLYKAPEFSLTDQDGKAFGNSRLAGKPWVADFIFTQCASLCPLMSSRMSGLQDRIPGSVKFVSFSVDPEHDTPAALTEYAAKYHADTQRWTFLTGPEKEEMRIVAGMKMYAKPAEGSNPIEHSPYFVLVDGSGNVRGVYDSNTEGEVEQLVRDAGLLAKSGGGAGK